MFGVLRKNPEFRTLWTAQAVSQAGDWLNRIAILALIGGLGDREAAFGLGALYAFELLMRMLPAALFSPLAGPIADRFPRRALMIASDLARALVVAAMVFVDEPHELRWLYVLLVCQVGCASFFEAARSGALPSTVPREQLLEAYALSAATWSTMLTVGTLISAVAIELLGVRGMLLLDAGSYLVSAAVLLRLKSFPVPEHPEALRWRDILTLTELRRGLRHARESGAGAGLTAKVFWGPAGGFLVMLSVAGRERFAPLRYAGTELEFDELALTTAAGTALAILLTGRGLGTGFGPVLARRLFGSSDRALLGVTLGGFFVGTAGYALFAVMPDLISASLCVLVAHLGGGALWVCSTTYWQRHVSNAFRGRVQALEFLGMTGAFSLGGLVGGLTFDASGSIETAVWTLCALVTVCGIVWGALLPRRTRPPSDPAPGDLDPAHPDPRP